MHFASDFGLSIEGQLPGPTAAPAIVSRETIAEISNPGSHLKSMTFRPGLAILAASIMPPDEEIETRATVKAFKIASLTILSVMAFSVAIAIVFG